MKWHEWTILALGMWAILSPWVLGFSAYNLAMWNNVLLGILMIIFVFGGLSKS